MKSVQAHAVAVVPESQGVKIKKTPQFKGLPKLDASLVRKLLRRSTKVARVIDGKKVVVTVIPPAGATGARSLNSRGFF